MPEDFEWLADGLDDEGPYARQQATQDARRLLPSYPEALQAVVQRLPNATMDGKLTMIAVLESAKPRRPRRRRTPAPTLGS